MSESLYLKPDGRLMGVPFLGEHSSLNIQTRMAYFVQMNAGSLLLAADSCNIEPHIPVIASNQLIKDCLTRGLQAERLFGEKEKVTS